MILFKTFMIVFWFVVVLFSPHVNAQQADGTINPQDNQAQVITGKAVALSGHHIRIDNTHIKLWGVEDPARYGPMVGLQARNLLDRFLREGVVSCEIVTDQKLSLQQGFVVGYCKTDQGFDLVEGLISNGYAVVDRAQVHTAKMTDKMVSMFFAAEERAKDNFLGLWSYNALGSSHMDQNVPEFLSQYKWYIISFGTLVGLLFLAAVCGFGLWRLTIAYKHQTHLERKRYARLEEREKAVLAASLLGELKDNSNKCQAFITIYSDMLKTLRNSKGQASYQQTGDFVHKSPALMRFVYDKNISHLDLLESSLVKEIAQLYTRFESDPEYITLEPDTPIASACRTIEMVIKNAEEARKSIEALIPDLEIVMRGKTSD